MSFSIGNALVDAHDRRLHTDVLIEGQWLRGHVLSVDGFVVVLEREDGSRSVARTESVSAVEVCSPKHAAAV